jgi:hypothetical protein
MKKLFSMVIMFLLVFMLSACTEETEDPIIYNPIDEENHLEVTIQIDGESTTHLFAEGYEGTLFDLMNEFYEMTYSESEFGIYLIALEDLYPKNGSYIAISENGEMAMSGIDQLTVEDGDNFTFEIIWYDSLLQEVDELITLFLDHHVEQYVNQAYIDVNVLSALYLLGIEEEYTTTLDLSTIDMFDASMLSTTADYFKAVTALGLLGEDTNELIDNYAETATPGPYGETAYGLMIILHNAGEYGGLIEMFEEDLNLNTPYSLGLDAGGISLVALANTDFENKQILIDQYSSWIQEFQLDTGGIKTRDMTWGENTYPGTENAASIAQVIIGLLANGIDPAGSDFTIEESNLISRLLDFATEEGSFDYLLDDDIDEDLMFSTPQAFLAIVMYQEYKTLGSSVNPYNID